MKIYISGQISGKDFNEVKERFSGAEDLLNAIGFETVNPLNNGLGGGKTWEEYMLRDIEILFGCDAIYMMDGWQDSKGAKIEHFIAQTMHKEVWFESMAIEMKKEMDEKQKQEEERILAVMKNAEKAIFAVTGMKFNQYVTKSRKRDGFFARMIFVHHCRKEKIKLTRIAQCVHRDHSSILHLLNKYEDEIRFNPQFRFLAEKVNKILNNDKTM